MTIFALANCASLPSDDLKKSLKITTQAPELTSTVQINVTRVNSTSIENNQTETVSGNIAVPIDSVIPVDATQNDESLPAPTRVKRIHLFRPMFVYRQEQVKKKRLNDYNNYIRDRNSIQRKQYNVKRNRYYNSGAARSSPPRSDLIDRYPYDRKYDTERSHRYDPHERDYDTERSGGGGHPQYSGNEDYYYGQRFLDDNQRSHPDHYDRERPIYERRPSKPASNYYGRSRHLDDESRYYDSHNTRYRP